MRHEASSITRVASEPVGKRELNVLGILTIPQLSSLLEDIQGRGDTKLPAIVKYKIDNPLSLSRMLMFLFLNLAMSLIACRFEFC